MMFEEEKYEASTLQFERMHDSIANLTKQLDLAASIYKIALRDEVKKFREPGPCGKHPKVCWIEVKQPGPVSYGHAGKCTACSELADECNAALVTQQGGIDRLSAELAALQAKLDAVRALPAQWRKESTYAESGSVPALVLVQCAAELLAILDAPAETGKEKV